MKSTMYRLNRVWAAAAVALGLLAGGVSVTNAAEDEASAAVTRLDQEAGTPAGGTQVENRLATNFTGLAGSEDNARKLVRGLRDGTPVTLSPTVTVAPSTGKMGYGNTAIAMSLAQENLAKAGITNPTPEQLQAALSGGSVTNAAGQTTQLAGVLALRASGQGWGQIAQSSGVRLGDVVSRVNGNGRGRGPEARDARGANPPEARGSNRGDTPPVDRGNGGGGNRGNAGGGNPGFGGGGGGMGGGMGGGNAGGGGGGGGGGGRGR